MLEVVDRRGKQNIGRIKASAIPKNTTFVGKISHYSNKVFVKGCDCILARDGNGGTWLNVEETGIMVDHYQPVRAELVILENID